MAPAPADTIVHATAVRFAGRGLLLRGPSAGGKSDLALRLIDAGADLIADDYVRLTVEGATATMHPPATIEGRMEVRGLGIVAVDWRRDVELALIADLVAPEKIERLPDPDWCTLAGLQFPRIDLAPFEASAVAKLRLTLKMLGERWPET